MAPPGERSQLPETDRVAEVGLVMCYFFEQGTWTAMPYTYGVDNTTAQAVDYTITERVKLEAKSGNTQSIDLTYTVER